MVSVVLRPGEGAEAGEEEEVGGVSEASGGEGGAPGGVSGVPGEREGEGGRVCELRREDE